jgi:hypothetical protein
MTADFFQRPGGYSVRFLTLVAVWAYGVTQPVFSIVTGNPELLVLRDVTTVDVVMLAVVLTILPALAAAAYVWLADRFSTWVGSALFLSILGAFLVPLASQLVKRLAVGTQLSLLMVAALSVAGVLLYARFRAVRLLAAYSIILPILGLASFVHGLPPLEREARAATSSEPSRQDIVVLVLDELPASSLMTQDGGIDALRYPNFARLAERATWYRNATTVHDGTAWAVPAILTGRRSSPRALPVVADHPENLFTLAAGTHGLRVHEAATRLCPRNLCPAEGSRLSRVDGLLTDVVRPYLQRILPVSVSGSVRSQDLEGATERSSSHSVQEFSRMLDEFDEGPRGTLSFAHLLLPHAPWRFLPSGRTYGYRGIDGWLPGERWEPDPWLVRQAFQRHVLQLQYTDTLLGKLLDRLEQLRIFDSALVVVVADHGASFRPSGLRRSPDERNLADIANVPLLVKYPGQGRGTVDDRAARTVDVVPTIADVLGIRLGWNVDGTSLVAPRRRVSVEVAVTRGDSDVVVRGSVAQVVRGRSKTIRRNGRLLGEGRDSVYRIGTHVELLGSLVSSGRRSQNTVVRIDDAEQFAAVDTSSSFLPARVSGVVARGRVARATELAIAVNGRIRALTRSFYQDGVQRFRALVPESAFRDGPNQVDVFAVRAAGSVPRLEALGPFRGPQPEAS